MWYDLPLSQRRYSSNHKLTLAIAKAIMKHQRWVSLPVSGHRITESQHRQPASLGHIVIQWPYTRRIWYSRQRHMVAIHTMLHAEQRTTGGHGSRGCQRKSPCATGGSWTGSPCWPIYYYYYYYYRCCCRSCFRCSLNRFYNRGQTVANDGRTAVHRRTDRQPAYARRRTDGGGRRQTDNYRTSAGVL